MSGHRTRKERQKDAAGLRERVCRALDLPPDCLPGESLVEIRGRTALTVHGCGRIVTYTPNKICIALKREVLTVEGSHLTCLSYYVNAIGVEGRIEAVRWEEEV